MATTEVTRVVLPADPTPTHYDLVLTTDIDARSFSCREQVSYTVSVPTTKLVLHSKEISISAASFSGPGGVTIKVTEIAYHLVDTTVTLTFETALLAGDGVLALEFKGILNSDMAGFYASHYTDTDGNKQTMGSTQFEALDARRAFPCVDEPAVKATFGLTMVQKANLTAISNMPTKSVKQLAGGMKEFVFDVTPKMSTYLLAWAVGEFDCISTTTNNGVAINIYSPPGTAARGQFALDVGKRALDFYDDYFGIPYPLPKLDMLCCTEFAAGAMENWGLVTYREVDLLIDEEKATTSQRQRVCIVITHELAHQWFGNLVTMDWWNDLWLNEGFASFMENFCADALFKDENWGIWDQFTTDTMGAALRLDALKSSHPIQVPICRAEEVEQVFDAISYCKGSTVVRMVFCLLGPAQFQEGLRNYMAKHSYGNTTTADLWGAWSEVSGQDINGIMEGWTMQMGYPALKVIEEEWTPDGVEFTLEQSWFLADGSSADDAGDKLWTIPLKFATGAGVVDGVQLMAGKTQSFKIPLANKDDFVKINAGQYAMARVSYTAAMTTRLQAAIKAGSLAVVDRAALIADAYALAKAGTGSWEAVVDLLKSYEGEINFTVWSALSSILRGLKTAMREVGGEAFEAFEVFAAKLVKSALDSVGWEPKEGVVEDHSSKLVRTTIIGLLNSFCSEDPEVLAHAKTLFDAHWDAPAMLPSDIKTTVYRLVLKAGGVQEYEQVLKTFYATTDNAERKFSLQSLGVTPSPALKLRTLDWAVKSGDVKLQDFFYPIGPTASNAEGAQMVWDYFKENLDLLKGMLKAASPSLMAAVVVNAISAFSTLERAQEVEDFFKASPVPSCERKIAQCVESIRNNGQMLVKINASKLVAGSYWA